MSQINVVDSRPEGDPRLGLIPRINDFETLQSIFLLQVDRSRGWNEAPLGQACWKLIGFELQAGTTEYKPRVLRESGQSYPDIVIYHYWPGAPQLPGGVRPPYFNQGQGRFTNGFGEAVFSPISTVGASGGSDAIWISASPPGQEPQFSDAVRNLGRHEATGLVPNPIFQYAVQDGSDLDVDGDDYTLSVVAAGKEVGQLVFSPTATGSDYIVLRRGTTELGRIPWQSTE